MVYDKEHIGENLSTIELLNLIFLVFFFFSLMFCKMQFVGKFTFIGRYSKLRINLNKLRRRDADEENDES